MNLSSFLAPYIDTNFTLESRSHPLINFGSDTGWYTKRDDELSFGISGCKYRKYASLIPFLKKNKISKVALVGSAFSNHLVGILQLLHENKIDYHLFLHQTREKNLKGNHLFIYLLSDTAKRTYLNKDQWKNKDTLIPSLIDQNTYYIPEGGLCLPALFGALTIACDVIVNQNSLNVIFDHIFIDAGSGLSAIGLLLSLGILKEQKHVHIVQTYYNTASFTSNLNLYKTHLEKLLDASITLPTFDLYPSFIGKSFGSTPEGVFDGMLSLAKTQGIFTDPIYTAKLFITAKEIAKKKNLLGNKLIIHSGGGLALTGFLDQIKKHLEL